MEGHITNPYYNLTAIRSLDMFYGRTNLLRRFYEMLFNRQSVSIIGPRGIGKSSFLCCACLAEMQARFPFDLSHHVFVPLDLRKYLYNTGEDFFHGVCADIIHQSQSIPGLSLCSDGHGADEFSKIVDQIERQEFFLVLLLDAFDNITLNERFGPEFFAFLRAHASSGKMSYVTATIKPLNESSHRRVVGSPFFNIFYAFTLNALAEEEALELIRQPAERAGMAFTPEEIAWIRRESGLHPFFIQRVCFVLFEEKRQSPDQKVDLFDVRKKAYQALLPYMNETWDQLSEKQRALLQDEAQQKLHKGRDLPEVSESAFFRQFVRNICEVGLAQMSIEELEEALNTMNDPAALGETNLRLMKAVTRRIDGDIPATSAEKGKAIRDVLNEAFERMRGSGVRSDTAPDWMLYNILFYRYFRHHLKNNIIADRLGYNSDRQYYRARTKAIEALRNILLEME